MRNVAHNCVHASTYIQCKQTHTRTGCSPIVSGAVPLKIWQKFGDLPLKLVVYLDFNFSLPPYLSWRYTALKMGDRSPCRS